MSTGAGPRCAGLSGLSVLHFGHFDPEYSRNRIMRKALERAGATVEVVTDPRSFVRRTPALLRAASRVRPDVVLVGFPGYADVLTSRVLAVRPRVPVVLDAFFSLEETEEDRWGTSPRSLRMIRYRLEDRVTAALADYLVLDTDAHARYFADHIGVARRKLRRIWVGADDDVMRPAPAVSSDAFSVFFYGSFIPLQGIDYILRAARLLEDRGERIALELVGSGQSYEPMRALAADLGLSSVRFAERVPYVELPARMAAADVCLGVFGTSAKVSRVIPNKVFDALATARAVITADTIAAREILCHGTDAWLVPAGDPEAIAAAIVWMKDHPDDRRRIATAGHDLFRNRFSLDALARDVTELITEIVH